MGYEILCFRWAICPSVSCSRAKNVFLILMKNIKTLSGLLVRFVFYTRSSFDICYFTIIIPDIQMAWKNQNTLKFPAAFVY
jgi:hypothetical protein